MADRILTIHDALKYDVDTQLKMVDNGDGTWSLAASVQDSALPSGAATAAKQDSLLTEMQLKADLSENFLLELSRGNISGMSHVNKFGSGTVAGGADETIWDGANLTGITGYTYMGSASTLYISSDNTNDDQTYEVQGLDENWALQTKTVIANGFNFVAITGLWFRVFRVKNIGTTDNAGNIYISDDNTDVGGNGIPDTLINVKAMIGIGNNQTLMSIYTVPAGKTAYIIQYLASVGKGDDVKATLWARNFGEVFQLKDHHIFYQRMSVRTFSPYPSYTEKTDIEIKGQIGAAGGEISAGFELILVND